MKEKKKRMKSKKLCYYYKNIFYKGSETYAYSN